MLDVLIVGLGNPGRSYARTRHNVGMQVVDHVAESNKWMWKEIVGSSIEAMQAGGDMGACRVMLAKPTTYMNLSGEPVQGLLTLYHVHPAKLLVVCDDMDLPAGDLRLRVDGSSGGHHGLDSIIERIGKGFPRLRIGIGKPMEGVPGERHVLMPFSADEWEQYTGVFTRAANAVRMYVEQGPQAAMNAFNA